MRALRFTLPTLLLASVVSMGLAQKAAATTMVYLPIESLYEMSDVVVRGTVRSHTSFWGDRGEMLTDWTVSVDEVLYDAAAADAAANVEVASLEQVTIRQMGGELDGRIVRIPGDATFADGEHVVVFLVEEEGVHYLTALGQAKLEVSLQVDPEHVGEGRRFGSTTDRQPVGSPEAIDDVAATLVRDLSEIAFFEPGEGEFFHLENEVLTLDQLRVMSPSVRAEPASEGGAQ